MMRFQPLPDDQIRQVIAMERPDISEAELAALLRIAEGVPGKALRYAGLDIAGLAGAIATIEGKGQAAAAAQTALSRSLSLKAAQPRYEAFLELVRSEEHTSELQSLMRISYAVFCLKKKKYSILCSHNAENSATT